MKLLCKVTGEHRWLLNSERREFVPIVDVCTRCGHQRHLLPWGRCLGEHPLADHYDKEGRVKDFEPCTAGGPQ